MAPLTITAAARAAAWPTRTDFGNASCPGTPGFHGRRFTCLPTSEACQGRPLRGTASGGGAAATAIGGAGAGAGAGPTMNASDPTALLRRLQAFMREAPAVASAKCPASCVADSLGDASPCGVECAKHMRGLWARQ